MIPRESRKPDIVLGVLGQEGEGNPLRLEARRTTEEEALAKVADGTILFHVGNGIWELEVKGNVQLRPRACFGPRFPDRQVTFLARAVERDDKLEPGKREAKKIALDNLEILKADPNRTRQVWPKKKNGKS